VAEHDVWASLGQRRSRKFVKSIRRLLPRRHPGQTAKPDCLVLHCLRRTEERRSATRSSKGHARGLDEAENRLHVQKAIMATLMDSNSCIVVSRTYQIT